MCWWPNCGIEGGDMKPHLLTSIVTFMSWSWVLAESDECPAQYEENCPSQSESACIPYNESDPSVFMYTIQGRLGNQITGYALLSAAMRSYGYRVFLEQSVLDNLDYYFDFDSAIASLDTLCMDTYPWETFARSPLMLESVNNRRGNAYELARKSRLLGSNLNDHLHWDTVLEPVEAELRDTFKFKKVFIEEAQEKLRSVADEYNSRRKKKKKKTKDLIFVGVHVRKGDADRAMIRHFGMPPLHASYFLSAMDLYSSLYRHVAFIVATDDPDWVRANIVPRVGKAAVFVTDNGDSHDRHSIGADLALLAQCNHTVLSYGTYSFWAGFLAGGKRGIPKMILRNRAGAIRTKNPLEEELPTFYMPDQGLGYDDPGR